MISSILITFIYCMPNKWNNQGPLIDTVSGAGGCMRVLKGRGGKKPESPLESRAVINEWRMATNYMHRLGQKDIHTHTHIHMHTIYPFICHSLFSSITFYHSDLVYEKAKCCECTCSFTLLMASDNLSLFFSPPPLPSFSSHR